MENKTSPFYYQERIITNISDCSILIECNDDSMFVLKPSEKVYSATGLAKIKSFLSQDGSSKVKIDHDFNITPEKIEKCITPVFIQIPKKEVII